MKKIWPPIFILSAVAVLWFGLRTQHTTSSSLSPSLPSPIPTSDSQKIDNTTYIGNSIEGLRLEIPEDWIGEQTKRGPIFADKERNMTLSVHNKGLNCEPSLAVFAKRVKFDVPNITKQEEIILDGHQAYEVDAQSKLPGGEMLSLRSFVVKGKMNDYTFTIGQLHETSATQAITSHILSTIHIDDTKKFPLPCQ